MKTIAAFLTFFVIFSCTANSQKSNQQTSQTRQVNGYTAIDAGHGVTVSITMGNAESVTVEADEDVIDRIFTKVDDGVLKIGVNGFKRTGKVKVTVTAVKLNSIKAGSGCSVYTTNLIESDELKLASSSGASLKAAAQARVISCKVSSGASARLKGVAKEFDAEASSGASVDAIELIAAGVKAGASSGGTVKVYAESLLYAEASSGGSVSYKGSPVNKDFNSSSGGSISQY